MFCNANANCGEIILQILIYGLSNGAVLALNAISVTVIYSTVRTLNLAHGDVFALTTVIVTTLVRALDVQPDSPPAILIGSLVFVLGAAMLAGLLLNISIERIAFKPFRGRSRLAPLIATLGISFMLFQVALVWRVLQPSWIWHEHRSVPGLPEVPTDGIPNLLPNINLVQALGLQSNVIFRFNNLFIVLMAVACAIGVSLFLRKTKTGRAIRAAAQNSQLAQISGVNLDLTIRRSFAFGGMLVGVAAFVFTMYYTRPFGSAGGSRALLPARVRPGPARPHGRGRQGSRLSLREARAGWTLGCPLVPPPESPRCRPVGRDRSLREVAGELRPDLLSGWQVLVVHFRRVQWYQRPA